MPQHNLHILVLCPGFSYFLCQPFHYLQPGSIRLIFIRDQRATQFKKNQLVVHITPISDSRVWFSSIKGPSASFSPASMAFRAESAIVSAASNNASKRSRAFSQPWSTSLTALMVGLITPL